MTERLIRHNCTVHTVAQATAFALQSLHAAAAASGNTYWRPTLAITCSPLDAGQTDIIIDDVTNQQQILGTQNACLEQKLNKDSRYNMKNCLLIDYKLTCSSTWLRLT